MWVQSGDRDCLFLASQLLKGTMEKRIPLTVLILIGLSLSSGAQTPQTAAPPIFDRVTFTDSIKEVAAAKPQFASSASATLVRSALSQAESEGTTEFSVALKMRDLAGLQKRNGNGETISLDEMAAKYFPMAADYQTIVDWLVAQGFAVKPADKYNLSVFASGSVQRIEQAFGTKFGRAKLPALSTFRF
jgi:Pro-kumamolisin, activation domain